MQRSSSEYAVFPYSFRKTAALDLCCETFNKFAETNILVVQFTIEGICRGVAIRKDL